MQYKKLPADAVKRRLTDINTKLSGTPQALSPPELAAVLALVDTLATLEGGGSGTATDVSGAVAALAGKCVGEWGEGERLVALDVLRVLVLLPAATPAVIHTDVRVVCRTVVCCVCCVCIVGGACRSTV